MRAVVIPQDEAEPVRLEHVDPGDDGSTLAALQALVDGNIEALPWVGPSDVTVYVNEEGKFTQQRNERATLLMLGVIAPGDFIAGNMVVIGFDPRAGANRDLDEQLADRLVRADAHQRSRGRR